MDWGLVANIIAAIGAILAAGAALWIATRDRQERQRERADTDRAQAELVQVMVMLLLSEHFAVEVRNYGTLPVLDVTFDSAEYEVAPSSTTVLQPDGQLCPVLDRYGTHTFWIDFVDDAGKTVMPGEFNDSYHSWTGDIRPDPSDVIARICFRDAEGTRWRRGNTGSAERLPS